MRFDGFTLCRSLSAAGSAASLILNRYRNMAFLGLCGKPRRSRSLISLSIQANFFVNSPLTHADPA